MDYRLLIINPGSTSTKLAIFEGEKVIWRKIIKHSTTELVSFNGIIHQLKWRKQLILKNIDQAGFKITDFNAIVARGGASLEPIPGGIYKIDKIMVEDLSKGENVEHASNLAGIISYELAKKYSLPAFTVDPISIDEFEPLARLSGLSEIPRRCQSHALNLKANARKLALELEKKIEEINLIGVHLGGGISVAAIKKGKIIDVNNANQGGPYSPERVGTLPTLDLIDYIFWEKPEKESFKKRLLGRGGLTAYLGTNDVQLIEKRIETGDKKAELVYRGMIYQIAKEIGKMAVVLAGKVDAIFITGGIAYSNYLVKEIKGMVSFIAPIKVYPGAQEMKYLAEACLRVLRKKEDVKEYDKEKKKAWNMIEDILT